MYSYMYECKQKIMGVCVYVYKSYRFSSFFVGLDVNWLVAGGQLSFRLGCICMNYINRSHGAGLDPGCPINSIHHAEISGNFIMISISQSIHSCQE